MKIQIEVNENYPLVECKGTHLDQQCDNFITHIFGLVCKCHYESVMVACDKHSLILEGDDVICSDCQGIKRCPKCVTFIVVPWYYHLPTKSLVIPDPHIASSAYITQWLQNDPRDFEPA